MYMKRGLRYAIFCTMCIVVIYVILSKYFEVKKFDEGYNNYLRHINMSEIDRGNLLNIESFEYVINADCEANFIVWIVTSYAADVSARSALRRAYSDSELKEFGIRRIFLLALLRNDIQIKTHVTQNAISDESNRYKDIIQGNFIEAYKNLTYKHVMGLKWATDYCKNVSHVMKMDHDIVINLYKIINVIKEVKISENTMMGYVLKNMIPIREPMNKWFVTRDEYPSDFYPQFLSGWLYITTRNTAKSLVNAVQNYDNKYFWIDDLFLTGIVRNQLDIKLHDIHELYTTNNEYLNCCLRDYKVKKYNCDFAIGPNGGDTALQIRFRDFSKYCRDNCSPRPKQFSVNNTCIVVLHDPDLGRGQAQILTVE